MCVLPLCPGELPSITDELGKSLDQAEVAIAFAPGGPAVWLVAITVQGTTADELIEARIAAAKPLVAPPVEVGLKRVRWELFHPSAGGADYVYANGRVLFILKYAATFGSGDVQVPPPTPLEVVVALEALA